MIPRKIHQTAKTADVPSEWRLYQDTLRKLHPTWEYKLWTDNDNLSLVAHTAPRWVSLYESLPRNIMRVDMIRYIILHLFGGLYLDLDYEVFRPFDLLDAHLVLPSESDPGKEVFLGNCVLASEPGHAFWSFALEELERGFSALGRAPLEEDVIWLTGPGLLTRAYKKYREIDPEIAVPPRNAFHPKTPQSEAEYEAVRRIPGVYGVHHCAGTWRARTVTQKIGRRIASLRAAVTRREETPDGGNGPA